MDDNIFSREQNVFLTSRNYQLCQQNPTMA